MRKCHQTAIRAFLDAKPSRPANSIHSDGERLFSYDTCLAQNYDGRIFVNVTKYSVATSAQQNALIRMLDEEGYPFEPVDDVPMGARELTSREYTRLGAL